MSEWRPFSEIPEWDHRPGRQFVRLEGYTAHSDLKWRRLITGDARLDRGGPFGYAQEDIERLMRIGDMEVLEAVTHWMPYSLPDIPPPQNAQEG